MLVAPQQTGSNQNKPLARNAVGYITCENHNDGFVLVLRPSPICLGSPVLLECFRRMANASNLTHSAHIFPLGDFIDDEHGGYYIIGRNRFITLGQLLQEKPSVVTDDAWVKHFVSDLTDTLEAIHANGTTAVELTPMSVLVSKDSTHTLMLMPPCGSFTFRKKELWPNENDFLAPELRNDEEIDVRTDIFAMTKLLQRLFRFSSIPPMYADLLRRGANPDKAKRPANMAAVRNMIQRSEQRSRLFGIVGKIAIIALIMGIIAWSFTRDEEASGPMDYQQMLVDSLRAQEDTSYLTGYEDEVEAFLRDSSYMEEKDTAITMSEEYKAQQKENYRKTIEVYRSQMSRIARSMLKPLYSREMMNGSETDFRQQSSKILLQLQEQQATLMQQYQIDPATAEAVAGEVIEEITNELKHATY